MFILLRFFNMIKNFAEIIRNYFWDFDICDCCNNLFNSDSYASAYKYDLINVH